MSTQSQYGKIVHVQPYACRSVTAVIPNRGRSYVADSAGDYRAVNVNDGVLQTMWKETVGV